MHRKWPPAFQADTSITSLTGKYHSSVTWKFGVGFEVDICVSQL